MKYKHRKKSRLSLFAKLFIRNEVEYPAALDGRVIPWIALSKNKKKKTLKIIRTKQNIEPNWHPVSRQKNQKQKKHYQPKTLKLAPLETQLKKLKLLMILKNNKPNTKKKITAGKTTQRPVLQPKQPVSLRHRTKI